MIYLISDIHGCYHSLLKLLKKIKFTNKDTLICLGDAIDRGKYSFEVIDYFINHNNCFLIKGNHELFFILNENKILDTKDWWNFGGNYTIQALNKMNIDEYLKYYNYINKLPLYIEIEDYLLTHSGFNADLSFSIKDDIILTKETIDLQYQEHCYNYLISSDIHYMPKRYFDKKIIVGHYPTLRFGQPKIHYGANCIDIDCGATYKGGKLGCLRLDDFEEFYVNIEEQDV